MKKFASLKYCLLNTFILPQIHSKHFLIEIRDIVGENDDNLSPNINTKEHESLKTPSLGLDYRLRFNPVIDL